MMPIKNLRLTAKEIVHITHDIAELIAQIIMANDTSVPQFDLAAMLQNNENNSFKSIMDDLKKLHQVAEFKNVKLTNVNLTFFDANGNVVPEGSENMHHGAANFSLGSAVVADTGLKGAEVPGWANRASVSTFAFAGSLRDAGAMAALIAGKCSTNNAAARLAVIGGTADIYSVVVAPGTAYSNPFASNAQPKVLSDTQYRVVHIMHNLKLGEFANKVFDTEIAKLTTTAEPAAVTAIQA